MGTGDFTVEAWIKMPTIAAGVYPIVSNQNYSGGAFTGINFTVFQQKIGLILADGSQGGAALEVYANISLSANAWHHVVGQRIGNTASNFKIYIDGVEGTKTISGTALTTGDLEHSAVRDMKIGSRSGSSDNSAFAGSIKQVRIYKRVLSATEVVNNFNNGYFLGPTDATSMVLWAPLNEGQGTQIKDYSTYNQAGSIVGSNVTWTNNFVSGQAALSIPINEYQYHLKDNLGNVRLTFTTVDQIDTSLATLETANVSAEHGNFLYYDEAVKINSTLFDHTNAGTTYYSTRLNGSTNERTGLAKSISVMPGDKIKFEVYAKYLDPTSSNWTTALNNLITSIANGTAPAGTFVDGGATGSTGGVTPPFGTILNKGSETGTAPKAYLNYLVFDRDYNFKYGDFIRLSTAGREYGQDGAHELLMKTLTIKEAGYVYVYLSNDNAALGGSQIEVYFDDFKVEQTKSPVIQLQDYYAFGLAFNDYRRESSMINQYQYNGKELQDELSLGWLDYGARMYMPEIGRWGAVDPLGEQMRGQTPYNYTLNNPIRLIDVAGLFPGEDDSKEDSSENSWSRYMNAKADDDFFRNFNYIAGSANPPSTHTDKDGNVVAVYDDGDNGVYRHDDLSGWDGESTLSTSGDGVSAVGETQYWDEFVDIESGQPRGTIIFGDSWEPLISWGNDRAINQDLSITMEESKHNQLLDIKTNKVWAPQVTGDVMTGRLLNGKYATARSAGNYLAGLNGVTGTFQGQHISGETYMKLAGAYQQHEFSKANILKIITYGASYGPAPYYGEDNYSGRRIQEGINAGYKKIKK